MGLFSKLFDPNAGEIKRLQKIVDKIDSFEEAHKKLSDSELRAKTEEFKNRFKKGETLEGDYKEEILTLNTLAQKLRNDRFKQGC